MEKLSGQKQNKTTAAGKTIQDAFFDALTPVPAARGHEWPASGLGVAWDDFTIWDNLGMVKKLSGIWRWRCWAPGCSWVRLLII